MTEQYVFDILRASLLGDEEIFIQEWEPIFLEMKKQAVAALPGEWLKNHLPSASSWLSFCLLQQRNWIRVMHGQSQILTLFESHHIPCVIIKGAAAAMYYPHPCLRTMGDVDVLVKRADLDKAATLLEQNGFCLNRDKDHVGHHYNYIKDDIIFEIHKRLPIIDDSNEKLLKKFEDGIDKREWHTTENYRFPVLPPLLNGLVLIFHIDQHLREGLGLRQIIDWMMYVNSLSSNTWEELLPLLQTNGVEKLALTVTMMCQKYFGLHPIVEDESLPTEKLMTYIMEKGNFGRKAGLKGKTATFSLFSTEKGGFFIRLQKGGLNQWKAAKKYRFLRPFAWIYQSFRILHILFNTHTSLKEILEQRRKGVDQRYLIDALGLKVEKTIREMD